VEHGPNGAYFLQSMEKSLQDLQMVMKASFEAHKPSYKAVVQDG
jgi:hypothetical protein